MSAEDLDLFAGPGGWDLAARELGADPYGIEFDTHAAATRDLNGLRTLQADVMALEPSMFAPVRGIIASPPCPTFSSGGGKVGLLHVPELLAALEHMADGRDTRHELGAIGDDRTLLVLEPLRWALELEPEWIALEQVPAVLPLWEATARVLEARGYSTAVAELNAADYGLPQDRRRAVLAARRDRVPTFAAPTTRRGPADVLDWHPEDLVGFPRRADRGRTIAIRGVDYRARDLRRAAEPCFTLTSKARSWSRIDQAGAEHRVELEEAAALQSFPTDYRWAGSRSSAFQQLGNAIPPELARIVLDAATG